MAKLEWNESGSKTYEGGLDRGVLYLDTGEGVVWNGLLSVRERPSTSINPVYFDGTRINNLAVLGDFAATLSAYTYPDEFSEYEGVYEFQDGVYLGDQTPKPFGLSYRTKIGSDAGPDQGYKIHVLYNLTATQSGVEYETLGLDPNPIEFEWDITAVPEDIQGYRPTAHLIIDSRRIDELLLADIEDILYGSDESPARLPSIKALSAFIKKWERIIITDNGDGTWSAEAREEGLISMLDGTTFQITEASATYVDPPDNLEYEISSTAKNEEDL